MKTCLILFGALLIVSSCSNDNVTGSGLVFANHMETIHAWNENHPANIVKVDNAHSGKFVCKVNTDQPYSSTFYMKLGDVTSGSLKKLKVSCWVLNQEKGAIPYIVVDILDKDMKTIDYISKNCKDDFKTENSWYEVTNTIKIASPARSNPENFLKVYVTNTTPQPVLVDDLIVEFIE